MAKKRKQVSPERSAELAKFGRKGGRRKKVRKGFAAMSPEQRRAASMKGVETRRMNRDALIAGINRGIEL